MRVHKPNIPPRVSLADARAQVDSGERPRSLVRVEGPRSGAAPGAATRVGVGATRPGDAAPDHVAVGGAPSATTSRGADLEALLDLPPLAATVASRAAAPKAEGVLQGLWGRIGDFFRQSSATTELSRARRVAKEVAALEPTYRAMTDSALRAETLRFKQELASGTADARGALARARAAFASASPQASAPLRAAVVDAERALMKVEQKVLEDLLPEAFAAVREASRRATGMFPYDVQVVGGALMHRGMIAEMYTGEGKTLAATMPVYLDALVGRGFHVATVNDYLARRDAEEMSAIYGFLGLSVGVLQSGHEQQFVIRPGQPAAPATRREAYEADITYATVSELGFDYLRDNQVLLAEDRVQRPAYAVLLDEVDSLLIDEARIPLILAGPGAPPEPQRLAHWDAIARKIHDDVLASIRGEPKADAVFDANDIEWEEHWVGFTDAGQDKLIAALGLPDLFVAIDPRRGQEAMHPELPYLLDALRAHFLMRENEQYAVVDGKVATIGVSGHLGPGRRFIGGLHQALEAKHGLEIQPENQTVASITMRDYLGLYAKNAGMTGTAASAREVLREVYKFDVARVPTRKPLVRVDYPDKHFATFGEKTACFLDDTAVLHATGRPILVGVEYTHTAEWLGRELEKRGLPVEVLGAKSDKEEAEIIARAGRPGAVTVVTTRGGRGVDVKLGGSLAQHVQDLVASGLPREAAVAEAGARHAKARAEVLAKGGLVVLAFEHLDSRRRDDQLRGRAARQGEPGATVFYSSAEDRLFDDAKRYQAIRSGDEAWSLSRAPRDTEAALSQSENKVNGALLTSKPFDQVIDHFRTSFYQARDEVLAANDGRGIARGLISAALDHAFEQADVGFDERLRGQAAADALWAELGTFLALPPGPPPSDWAQAELEPLRAKVDQLVDVLLSQRDAAVGGELAGVMEKADILRACDRGLAQFIDEAERLRQAIHWRAFAQKEPRTEFLREVGILYGQLMASIAREAAATILTTTPQLPPLPHRAPR
jgi:preprotein translocase subunit SecA